MTAIREALDAASNAGVEVVWPDGVRCLPNFIMQAKDEGGDSANVYDQAAADLTVAAIKRGLLKRHYVRYECVYTPSAGGVYRVAIGWSGREPIDGDEASTELAALTAALRQLKEPTDA